MQHEASLEEAKEATLRSLQARRRLQKPCCMLGQKHTLRHQKQLLEEARDRRRLQKRQYIDDPWLSREQLEKHYNCQDLAEEIRATKVSEHISKPHPEMPDSKSARLHQFSPSDVQSTKQKERPGAASGEAMPIELTRVGADAGSHS